jgi:hypothetical protein
MATRRRSHSRKSRTRRTLRSRKHRTRHTRHTRRGGAGNELKVNAAAFQPGRFIPRITAPAFVPARGPPKNAMSGYAAAAEYRNRTKKLTEPIMKPYNGVFNRR